jgi:hypothetical protein
MNHPISDKRVLVIAYNFPPVGGAGVQRVTKFVKYLPQFGWKPTVLTVENPSVPLHDHSLLREIPANTEIVRARTGEPGYALKRFVSASASGSTDSAVKQTASSRSSLAVCKRIAKRGVRALMNLALQPDPQVLWNRHALQAGMRVLNQTPHDVIFVTAPPFSSFLLGAELSRRTGVPLVLDYRDEWSISNSYLENRRLDRVSQWWQQRLQQQVLRSASAVLATTEHSAQALASIVNQSGSQARVTHIYNGFDSADFHAGQSPLPDAVLDPPANSHASYKLAYIGTLWNLTSVEPLVKAVERLSSASPELAECLELSFIGRRTAAQDELLRRLEVTPCKLTRQDYLEHDAAVRLMQSADGLCLLLSDVPEAGRVVPAKLFEYMAVRKPIFAIVPPGEVATLLQDCPIAFVHAPNQIETLAQRLGDEIERHRLGISLPSGLWDNSRFERRRQAEQLAQLLNEVSGCESTSSTGVATTKKLDHVIESDPALPTIGQN